MATPLESFRSGNPTLYQYGNDSLIDLLWKEHGQSKYEDESIFREYLTTETELFDRSRLKTTTPIIESEQPELPEGKVNGEVSPFRQKEYWVDVLQNIAQMAVTTTGLTVQGVAGLQAFAELPEEKQKLVFDEDTALYKTFKELGLLNEKDQLDLSWLPSEDNETKFLRERSEDILANQDKYSDERISWAQNIQETLASEKIPIKERYAYKLGQEIQEFGREAIPVDREKWQGNYLANLLLDTSGVIGSTLPFIATGIVGSSIKVGAVTLALPATMAVGSGEAIERAYNFQEQDGVRNEDDIAIAAILGVGPGALDYMPVGVLLNRFSHIRPGSKGFIRRFFEAAVSQGLWEGGTEEAQQFLQNMIAQDYNANQDLYEHIGKQFLPAFLGGGLMGGIGMGGQTTPTVPTKEDKLKEKIVDKEIGDKPTEEQKEKAQEGSPDEVKKDFSPDGSPPMGAKVSVSEAGVNLGNGKIISYDRDIEDDSIHVKMEMEDGTIIDRPADELDMVWLDKPDVKEEVTDEDAYKKMQEKNLAEGKPQYQARDDIVETIPEEVTPTEEGEYETRLLSLSELLKEWETLPVGEGLTYKDVYYQKGRYKEPLPEEIAKDKEDERLIDLWIKPTEEVAPVEEEVVPVEEEVEEVTPTEEDVVIPPDAKVGDAIEVYNAKGEKYKTKITAVDPIKTLFDGKETIQNQIKVLNQKGDDVIVGMNLSATLENIRDPNYKIGSSIDAVRQGQLVSEMSDEQLARAEEELNKKVEELFAEGKFIQGVYYTAFMDRNAVKAAIKDRAKLVEEPKVKVLTDNIKTVGNWNNVFEANKDNEEVIDQLTQFDLEGLINKETKPAVLNVVKNKLQKGKFKNEAVQKNWDTVNKRIEELKGEPVEEVAPVVKPVEEKKPKEFIDKILSSEEVEEKVEEKVEKTTGVEELAALNNEQINSMIDDIASEIEVEEEAPVEKEVVKEKVKEIKKETQELQPPKKFPDNYQEKLNALIEKGFNGSTKTAGSKVPLVRELYDINRKLEPDFIIWQAMKQVNKDLREITEEKKKPVVKEELTKVEKAQGIFKLYNPERPLITAKEYNNELDSYVREIIDPSLIGNRYLDAVKDAYVQRIEELTDVKMLDKLALFEKDKFKRTSEFNKLKNHLGISLSDIREPMTGKVVAEDLAIDKGKVQSAINHINDNILKKEVKAKPVVEEKPKVPEPLDKDYEPTIIREIEYSDLYDKFGITEFINDIGGKIRKAEELEDDSYTVDYFDNLGETPNGVVDVLVFNAEKNNLQKDLKKYESLIKKIRSDPEADERVEQIVVDKTELEGKIEKNYLLKKN